MTFQTKKNTGVKRVAKMKNVFATPNLKVSHGKNCETKPVAPNRQTVDRDMAFPRILIGKISDIIIQGKGPSEKAKQARKKHIKKIKNMGF